MGVILHQSCVPYISSPVRRCLMPAKARPMVGHLVCGSRPWCTCAQTWAIWFDSRQLWQLSRLTGRVTLHLKDSHSFKSVNHTSRTQSGTRTVLRGGRTDTWFLRLAWCFRLHCTPKRRNTWANIFSESNLCRDSPPHAEVAGHWWPNLQIQLRLNHHPCPLAQDLRSPRGGWWDLMSWSEYVFISHTQCI